MQVATAGGGRGTGAYRLELAGAIAWKTSRAVVRTNAKGSGPKVGRRIVYRVWGLARREELGGLA